MSENDFRNTGSVPSSGSGSGGKPEMSFDDMVRAFVSGEPDTQTESIQERLQESSPHPGLPGGSNAQHSDGTRNKSLRPVSETSRDVSAVGSESKYTVVRRGGTPGGNPARRESRTAHAEMPSLDGLIPVGTGKKEALKGPISRAKRHTSKPALSVDTSKDDAYNPPEPDRPVPRHEEPVREYREEKRTFAQPRNGCEGTVISFTLIGDERAASKLSRWMHTFFTGEPYTPAGTETRIVVGAADGSGRTWQVQAAGDVYGLANGLPVRVTGRKDSRGIIRARSIVQLTSGGHDAVVELTDDSQRSAASVRILTLLALALGAFGVMLLVSILVPAVRFVSVEWPSLVVYGIVIMMVVGWFRRRFGRGRRRW